MCIYELTQRLESNSWENDGMITHNYQTVPILFLLGFVISVYQVAIIKCHNHMNHLSLGVFIQIAQLLSKRTS